MRVLVVRPRADAERTARRLAAMGHEAVVAPLFAIVPTGAESPTGTFAAFVLTSANAVPALPAALADQPVYAVGDRTAEAARRAGFVRTVSAGGDAADLAARIARDMAPGAALLHCAGRDRKPEPAAALTAAGYRVTVWECYASPAVATLPEPALAGLRDGSIEAALHYSRRSAAHLRALAQAAGLSERFAALAHACLSAEVAGGLPGIRRLWLAERPDEDALLALLGRETPLPPGLARATIGVLRTELMRQA